MYLKHVTTISVFLAPIILAGVAPFNLDTRSGCNADNCLRALQRKGSAANSFCASYTAATTTEVTSTLCQSKKRILTSNLLIGLPSYVPKICGPSRVSSACSCIASQTSTSQTSTSQTSAPSACSTGQVVVNPVRLFRVFPSLSEHSHESALLKRHVFQLNAWARTQTNLELFSPDKPHLELQDMSRERSLVLQLNENGNADSENINRASLATQILRVT